MNALTSVTKHAVPANLPVACRSADAATSRDAFSFARQRDVIPGMLASLDSLSTAGQRYVMAKVVSFIHQHAGRAADCPSLQNQGMFAELVARLTRESDRLMPDARAFACAAESLVALLSVV
jgi:hypothetical protein